MKRKFEARVRTERQVLAIVNELVDGMPLNGLGNDAIEAWAQGQRGVGSDAIELLRDIASRMLFDTDGSREVFLEEENRLAKPVEFHLNLLKSKLLNLRHMV